MNHKDLEVWKEGIEVVTDIYRLTNSLPASERYGLSSQMRRSAVSIPANIAEGAGRNSDKELIQFLYISLGSLEELETMLIISKKLKYIEPDQIEVVNKRVIHIRKLLTGLIKYLKSKK